RPALSNGSQISLTKSSTKTLATPSEWRRSWAAVSIAASGETPSSIKAVPARCRQVAGDQRHPDVELELTLAAGDGDRGVVADHLGGDLDHDLGDHRVDLAGHDRGPLLKL